MIINRYLEDKAMDRIDHALGRPLDPMRESYRNYFAVDGSTADELAAAPHWAECRRTGSLRGFGVTRAGRAALAEHLRAIGDKHRAFRIVFQGISSTVVAKSRSKARYSYFLDVRDVLPDLTFADFSKRASVFATDGGPAA